MLISAFPKASLTKKTMKQVFSLLAWSFEILFSGVIPKKDLFGNQMENYRGRRVRPGVLYSITGEGASTASQTFDPMLHGEAQSSQIPS